MISNIRFRWLKTQPLTSHSRAGLSMLGAMLLFFFTYMAASFTHIHAQQLSEPSIRPEPPNSKVWIIESPPRRFSPRGSALNNPLQRVDQRAIARNRAQATAGRQRSAAERRLINRSYPLTNVGFIAAARQGTPQDLRDFINLGWRLNVRGTGGGSILHSAVQAENISTTQYLIEQRIPLEIKDSRGETPLLLATRRGFNTGAGALLAAGANIAARDLDDWTALFHAAARGDGALIRSLLQYGADVHRQGRFGQSPLLLAARHGHLEAVVQLLDHGARLGQRDLAGNTPLLLAVQRRHVQVAQELLIAGANANDINNRRERAIDLALMNNDRQMANLLLSYGARRPSVLGR